MYTYTPKKFNINTLIGISEKNIEEHLTLYAGYVKHVNFILSTLHELEKDIEKNIYSIGELRRRFSFEYNGMRNHEIYFSSLEGGQKNISANSMLHTKICETWGDFDTWLKSFKTLALTRGIGWAVLYYDTENNSLLHSWVDEQHLGQLIGLTPILCLDMWEHSYVSDYYPSGKKQYIEDFFKNINWSTIENRLQ